MFFAHALLNDILYHVFNLLDELHTKRSTNGKIQHLGRLLAAERVAGACSSGRAASASAAQVVARAAWAAASMPSRQHFKYDNVHSTPRYVGTCAKI